MRQRKVFSEKIYEIAKLKEIKREDK